MLRVRTLLCSSLPLLNHRWWDNSREQWKHTGVSSPELWGQVAAPDHISAMLSFRAHYIVEGVDFWWSLAVHSHTLNRGQNKVSFFFFLNVRTISIRAIRSWKQGRLSPSMLRCPCKVRECVHLSQKVNVSSTSCWVWSLSLQLGVTIPKRIQRTVLAKYVWWAWIKERGEWGVSYKKELFSSWNLPPISRGIISGRPFFFLSFMFWLLKPNVSL